MKWRTRILLAALLSMTCAGPVLAQASGEQLRQMVEQLQKAPDDSALRERIIKLARELKPSPAIPEGARRFLGRGIAAFETAKDTEGFRQAMQEFQRSADVAPWWADPYFNLGQSAEKAGDLKAAMAAYRFYLAASPDSADADKVRTHMYKLEFLAEQKDKEKAAQARDDETRKKRQAWAADIVSWLRTNYGGRLERQSICYAGNADCTAQDAEGRNWSSVLTEDSSSSPNLVRENRRFTYAVVGPGLDQIQLELPYFSNSFCGVPSGPDLASVRWTYCGKETAYKNFTAEFEFAKSRDNKPWIGVTYGCTPAGRCRRERNVLEN